ncbi:MAG: ParA family protein, partial [Planctomycetota bacterium]
MRTIAVVNQKGGCGKTTVSINLASALADMGYKTLLVDMDPQSHCAVGLAVPEDQIEQSIYDVLISTSRSEPVRLSEVLWQISNRLELAPASIDLSAFEQQMVGIAERECCLKNVLDQVNDEYDYAIVDCPPAVGLLTFNALRAATDAIVPVETGYFALHGLSKQLETLGILCKRCDQQVDVRVLASMYDIRTKMAREILAELRNHFADKMFKTIVNFNTKLKEAASLGQPIAEYDPVSRGQMDFHSLAEEVMGSRPKEQRHEMVKSLAGQLEAISTTADELLKSAKIPKTEGPPIQEIQAPKTERPQKTDTDIKLTDYYGVSQL